MADEFKEEDGERSEKDEQSKDEIDEREMVDDLDDSKEESIEADIKKDGVSVEKQDEESIQMKGATVSVPFAGDLNRGGEMNDTVSDMGQTAKVPKTEKPRPMKRGLISSKEHLLNFEAYFSGYAAVVVQLRSAFVGLFDEPIVREGKRQRHAVERLAAISSPPPRKAFLDAVGSGTSLGDIEFVNIGISKAQNETLKWLHRLCYGTPGTATTRRRDLRRFNGFAFDEKSADFDKKKATAMKCTSNELHMIGRILGSERGHTKEEAVMNVLHFLQKPEDKGRKVTPAKKRRSGSKSKGKKTERNKAQGKGSKKGIKKAKEANENDDAGHSGEESSGDEDSEEKKSESTSMAKDRSEKMKSSAKLTSVSKSTAAKEHSTWGDGGPSDAQVENAINEILRSVDLVNCTMKQMCERIAEKFPNLDMATYKGALKERVKVALEKMEDS